MASSGSVKCTRPSTGSVSVLAPICTPACVGRPPLMLTPPGTSMTLASRRSAPPSPLPLANSSVSWLLIDSDRAERVGGRHDRGRRHHFDRLRQRGQRQIERALGRLIGGDDDRGARRSRSLRATRSACTCLPGSRVKRKWPSPSDRTDGDFLIRRAVDDHLRAAEPDGAALRRDEAFDDAAAGAVAARAPGRREQQQAHASSTAMNLEPGNHPISLWSIPIGRSIHKPDRQRDARRRRPRRRRSDIARPRRRRRCRAASASSISPAAWQGADHRERDRQRARRVAARKRVHAESSGAGPSARRADESPDRRAPACARAPTAGASG